MPAPHSSVRSSLHGAVAPVCGRLVQPFGQEVLLNLLNRALARQFSEGEYTFLIDHVLAVSITDLEVRWLLTANAAGDRIVKATEPPDATIRADSTALLLIAAPPARTCSARRTRARRARAPAPAPGRGRAR